MIINLCSSSANISYRMLITLSSSMIKSTLYFSIHSFNHVTITMINYSGNPYYTYSYLSIIHFITYLKTPVNIYINNTSIQISRACKPHTHRYLLLRIWPLYILMFYFSTSSHIFLYLHSSYKISCILIFLIHSYESSYILRTLLIKVSHLGSIWSLCNSMNPSYILIILLSTKVIMHLFISINHIRYHAFIYPFLTIQASYILVLPLSIKTSCILMSILTTQVLYNLILPLNQINHHAILFIC